MGRGEPRHNHPPPVELLPREKRNIELCRSFGHNYNAIVMSVHRRTGCGLCKAKELVTSFAKELSKQ